MLDRSLGSGVPPVSVDPEASERARLHEALREAWIGARSDESISGEELLRDLAAEE